MSEITFPKDIEFAQTLRGLLGREVKVKTLGGVSGMQQKNCCIGLYDDGKGRLEAGWISDAPLSASLAAALTLVPSGVAKEASKSPKMPPDLLENIREVANIAANSFGGQRVRLVEFAGTGENLSDLATQWLQENLKKAHYEVSVSGYLVGNLTLLLLLPSEGAR